MQIYTEICLCQSSYKCHILIQAHLANLSSDPGEGTLLINSSAPARKTDCRVPLSYCGTSECFLLWRSWLPFLTFTLSSSLTFTLSDTQVSQRSWLPSDSSHLDSSALFQVLIILSHNRPIWANMDHNRPIFKIVYIKVFQMF